MQARPASFDILANGDVRPLSWGASISFTKEFSDAVTFFILNTSLLDGPDLLSPVEDNPIQEWDYYKYVDYTDYVIYIAITRELEFPYSVVSSIADFQLKNENRYFSPNSNSPIASYILPKRPVRLLQGFGQTVLPQFVGLTQGMPTIVRSGDEATATFTAMDFLTVIFDMPIRETEALINIRTDEVLANIFTQFGLLPNQYDLAKARNTIPFLFFERDQQTAGDIIRPLMQAEMGMLWLDEQGIIRFRPRLEQIIEPVYLFNDENIISIDTDGDDSIINHVIINTNVRELQEAQAVLSLTSITLDSANRIPASTASYPYKIALDDPTLNIVVPTYGESSGQSWFTALNSNGEIVASGVSIAGTANQTNSYTLFIANSNPYPVYVYQVNLWGQPAKVIGGQATIYDNKDTDSIDKYEDITYTIDNNFVQSVDQARSLALTMLDEYSEYANIITTEVKGNPALQLSDVIQINHEEYAGLYRIIGIRNKLQDNKSTQILRGKVYNPRDWFTLDVSQLNGLAVLAP